MRKYNKPPLTYQEQIDLLARRGLIIKDRDKAEQFLAAVNYYRFSAYCIPFEESRHKFRPNVYFEQVQKLYEFDRQLRFLIDEALEIIEIAVRSRIAYYLSHQYGAFVHEDASKFFQRFNHTEWITKVHEEAERSQETFITHYKNTYEDFPKIPLWIAVEIMSFGSLSKLFHNLMRRDQITVAKHFGFHSNILASWLHTFVYIRNICAHHSRLWNRELAIAMKIPKDERWKNVNSKRVASVIFAINMFLSVLQYGDHIKELWRKEMEDLFSQDIPIDNFYVRMGVNVNLINHPLWRES